MKKSLFLCDLHGTFEPNNEMLIEKFISLLEKLDSNPILDFSFLTSEKISSLSPYLKQMIKHIPKNSKFTFRYSVV